MLRVDLLLIACFSLQIFWLSCAAVVLLPQDEASSVLRRQRRFNTGALEELWKDNLERECMEELCSWEEAREVFENKEKTMEFWAKYKDGDQCQSSPCRNAGQCVDGVSAYTCSCQAGFVGTNCEISVVRNCNVNNGGCAHFCVDVTRGTTCTCAAGYQLGQDGATCEPKGEAPCGTLGMAVMATMNSQTVKAQDGVQPAQQPNTARGAINAGNKPAPVVKKPAPVADKPTAVGGKPAAFVVKPTPVVGKLTPVASSPTPGFRKLDPVAGKPALVASSPALVVENPAPVAGNHAPVISNPAPMADNHAPVINNLTPVAGNHAPVISNPAPMADNHAPVINNLTPVAGNHAPVISNPTPVAGSHAPVISNLTLVAGKPALVAGNHTLAVDNPAPVAVNPAPMAGKPARVASNHTPVAGNAGSSPNVVGNPTTVAGNPAPVVNKPTPIGNKTILTFNRPTAVGNKPTPEIQGELPTSTEEDADSARSRIVGGYEVTPGEIPWQVALVGQETMTVFCGGSILSARWVVTAAHCLSEEIGPFFIRAGEHNVKKWDGTEQDVEVSERHLYPQYDAAVSRYKHDVALLRTHTPLRLTEAVRPICLGPQAFTEWLLQEGAPRGRVSGWGRLKYGGATSPFLHKVDLPFVERTRCMASSSERVTRQMFCAGYATEHKDACQGDSGGPYASRRGSAWFLTGIVSWGEECAAEGKYGVYTRISYYYPWIAQVMGLQDSPAAPLRL